MGDVIWAVCFRQLKSLTECLLFTGLSCRSLQKPRVLTDTLGGGHSANKVGEKWVEAGAHGLQEYWVESEERGLGSCYDPVGSLEKASLDGDI